MALKFGIILLMNMSILKGYSQDNIKMKLPNPIHVEMSANVTQFVKQFLSLSTSSFEVSPYLIGARIYRKFNSIRAHVGINYNYSNETSNFGDNKINILNNNFRVGYQREMRLSNHFSSYLGVDLLYKNDKSITSHSSNGFSTEQRVEESGFGASPTFGIQWNFTNRLGLYTEIMLPIMITHSKNYQTGSGIENKSDADNVKLTYTHPTSLFLTYKF